MVRLDAHCHLGSSYPGKVQRSQPVGTIDKLLEHFERNELTHVNIIYKPDEKHLLEKLLKMNLSVKIYPLQWIDSYDEPLNEWDVGVKLHPMRGKRINPLVKKARRYLDNLPEGFKVLIHTQGSSSLSNISRPQLILELAIRHSDKIFIIGHSGAYGFRSYMPSEKWKEKSLRLYRNLLSRYYHSALLVNEAYTVSTLVENVWLESSYIATYLPHKVRALTQCFRELRKILLGSDFPYLTIQAQDIRKQEKCLLAQGLSEEDIEEIHYRGVQLMES